MSLRIAIVEDSIENIETLTILLDKVLDDKHEIIGVAKTMGEAELLLSRTDIDVAFLDIQLKEGTTFEVLDKLSQKSKIAYEIVFVTAHSSFEFATKAIQFACLDFITKPIDEADLQKVLSKISEKQPETSGTNQQLNYLIQMINENVEAPSSIGIHLIKSVIEFIEVDDIVYFTADKNTCKIFLSDDRALNSIKNMGYYKELLSAHPEFIQINKSCIANAKHIKQYNPREKVLTLKNGNTLLGSHRFNKHIKDQLMKWHSTQRSSKGGLSFLKKLLGGSK